MKSLHTAARSTSMIMTILIIFNILTANLQNVPATSSQSTQEMKKSNLKSQNGELDYKKVNNKWLTYDLLCEFIISSGRNRKQRIPN